MTIKIFFAFIFLLLFSNNGCNSSSSSSSSKFSTRCDQTSNSASCEQTLKSDPRARTATDVLNLAEIAFELARRDTTKSRDFIYRLAANSSRDRSFETVLKGCANRIEKDFNNALRELEAAAPNFANNNLLDAGDRVGYCVHDLVTKTRWVHVEELDPRFEHTLLFVDIGKVLTSAHWYSSPPPPAFN